VKSIKLLVALGCLGLSSCTSEREAEPLGETLNADNEISAPSLAFGPNGHLVVSWAGRDDVHVRRWTGSRWESLSGGGLSAFPGETRAYWSSLRVDGQGDPVIAWTEEVPEKPLRKSIFVRRWADGGWVEVGEPLNINAQTRDAYKPSLRLDSEGNPLVAWSEQATGPQLAVRRWGPGGWQALGPNPIAEGTAWGLELMGDTPVLMSHRDEDYGRLKTIDVRRWTGSTWEKLGDSVGVQVVAPQMRADAAGNLVLAWLEDGVGYTNPPIPDRLQVARWSGTAWEALPDVAVTVGDDSVSIPALDLDAEGRPLVAWNHYEDNTQSLRVARWTGQEWNVTVVEEVSAPLLGWFSKGSSTIGFHPTEGVVVAWTPEKSKPLRVLRLLP